MGNGMDPEKKGEQAWKNGERDGNEDRITLLLIMEDGGDGNDGDGNGGDGGDGNGIWEMVEMEMVRMEMM